MDIQIFNNFPFTNPRSPANDTEISDTCLVNGVVPVSGSFSLDPDDGVPGSGTDFAVCTFPETIPVATCQLGILHNFVDNEVRAVGMDEGDLDDGEFAGIPASGSTSTRVFADCCGDGVVNQGFETCDTNPRGSVPDTGPECPTCPAGIDGACRPPGVTAACTICGDGILQPDSGETCDFAAPLGTPNNPGPNPCFSNCNVSGPCTCTGAPGCPPSGLSPPGTPCPDGAADADPCTKDICNGFTAECIHEPKGVGAACVATSCDDVTTCVCNAERVCVLRGTCGNGIPGEYSEVSGTFVVEECDLGAQNSDIPGTGFCCSSACTRQPITQACQPDDKECTDAFCDETGTCKQHSAFRRSCQSQTNGRCDRFGECLPVLALCGDGDVDATEACDDGGLNGLPESCCSLDCRKLQMGTGCTSGVCDDAAKCVVPGVCGDGNADNQISLVGTRWIREECDLGPDNTNNDRLESCCNPDCGVQESGFICRRSDTVCIPVTRCGDGEQDPAGACPASDLTAQNGARCAANCFLNLNGACSGGQCIGGGKRKRICDAEVRLVDPEEFVPDTETRCQAQGGADAQNATCDVTVTRRLDSGLTDVGMELLAAANVPTIRAEGRAADDVCRAAAEAVVHPDACGPDLSTEVILCVSSEIRLGTYTVCKPPTACSEALSAFARACPKARNKKNQLRQNVEAIVKNLVVDGDSVGDQSQNRTCNKRKKCSRSKS